VLAGATAAAAGVLLLGWPNRPPLPGQPGQLAAVALVAVALLLVFVPALPAWRRVPALPHAGVTGPAMRPALEPAR
jgi:hypothetical protein